MKQLLAAGAALSGLALPAAAQSFDGPRIELQLGWDRADTTVTYSNGTDRVELSTGRDGLSYGGELGYDYRAGNVVVGAYGNLNFATTGYCNEDPGVFEECIKANRNIGAGLRVGYVIRDSALVYVKGGYSNGQVRYSYQEPARPQFWVEDTLHGFHVGGGGEVLMTPNIYGKVDYSYADYNGYEYTSGSEKLSVDLSRHQVTAGLGYRF